MLSYKNDERVSKHADMWEWTRAKDSNAAEMKLPMSIEWLQMLRDLRGEFSART